MLSRSVGRWHIAGGRDGGGRRLRRADDGGRACAIARRGVRYRPARVVGGLSRRRAGLRPATIDELPVIGASAVMPNLMYATGHYRNGVLLAPLTAQLVADAMLDNRIDRMLVSPARLATVGTGKVSTVMIARWPRNPNLTRSLPGSRPGRAIADLRRARRPGWRTRSGGTGDPLESSARGGDAPADGWLQWREHARARCAADRPSHHRRQRVRQPDRRAERDRAAEGVARRGRSRTGAARRDPRRRIRELGGTDYDGRSCRPDRSIADRRDEVRNGRRQRIKLHGWT